MCKDCKKVEREIQGVDILASVVLGIIGFGSLLTLLVVSIVTTLL